MSCKRQVELSIRPFGHRQLLLKAIARLGASSEAAYSHGEEPGDDIHRAGSPACHIDSGTNVVGTPITDSPSQLRHLERRYARLESSLQHATKMLAQNAE